MCERCGLGLILRARQDVAPLRGEAFLVVDDLLRVRALSHGAERLLGTVETAVVDRHLGEIFVSAGGPSESGDVLAAAVSRAALGGGEPVRVIVRQPEHGQVRYTARIGACAPGPAAVIVVTGEI